MTRHFIIFLFFSYSFVFIGQAQMIGFSALLGPCLNGAYTLGGNLLYQNPPSTGQLIITNCAGQEIVFDPPFTENASYSFPEVPATGGACSLTAYFTANTSYTISLTVSNVPLCPCNNPQIIIQNYNVCEADLPVTFSGFTFFESGQEELLFSDVFGCDSTVVVSVTVQPTPVPSFDYSAVEGCTPFEVNFASQNTQANATCEWNFGTSNQNVVGCGIQNYVYHTEGCYDVSLTVTNTFGCSATATITDLICVVATPNINFTASPLVLERWNAVTQFMNMSTNAQSFIWDFGDNSGTSNAVAPSHQYPEESAQYLVTLTAYNEYCVDSAKLNIIVQDNPISYIPNAFTPDGEGLNEIFQPIFFTGFDPSTYNLTIFNRWGELIFESNHYAKGWGGTYGEKPCPEGTYIYQISFKHADNDNVSLVRGHFSLLR